MRAVHTSFPLLLAVGFEEEDEEVEEEDTEEDNDDDKEEDEEEDNDDEEDSELKEEEEDDEADDEELVTPTDVDEELEDGIPIVDAVCPIWRVVCLNSNNVCLNFGPPPPPPVRGGAVGERLRLRLTPESRAAWAANSSEGRGSNDDVVEGVSATRASVEVTARSRFPPIRFLEGVEDELDEEDGEESEIEDEKEEDDGDELEELDRFDDNADEDEESRDDAVLGGQ